MHRSKYDWFFKYKLYHLPFWFIYHCLWWTLTIGSAWEVVNNILFSPYSIKFLFYVVFQAIGVYFNLYFLIPRFLEKGRYVSYVSLLMLTILCTAALIVPGYYVSAWWSGRPFQELYNVEPGNYLFFFKINTLPSTVASTTLAMSIKLTKNWIQSIRRQQLQEKEKLETELKFLRSQFNPHFLFNTINSIFFLIHKNPVMASDSLAKFSDLLRYQLYECNEKQIPLSNEITYLENFIELEKLRQSNLEVTMEIDQMEMDQLSKHHLAIAPFVLMTFTENAFKHVSSHKNSPNWIRLHLSLNGFQFQFKISNSMSTIKSNEVVSYGGIGLLNVKRRLDLIYPGQYQLNIQNNQTSFEVELSLNLSEISEPQPIKINKSAQVHNKQTVQ